ncbi:MAG: 30S ribosome-binding factor RbfA [Acidobacteria bacterium]|nr:30S ribosome-binding factor RbfA [Acidobacteriota bacterium]
MHRPAKMAETLKEAIAEVVGFELNDPRLESVIVTDVVVADDLRDAKVFILAEGSEKEINAILAGLGRAEGFVRRQIALDLELRHVPHLHFVRDTAEENAARVGTILQELSGSSEIETKEE